MCSRQELQTITESVVSAVLNIVADKIYKIILSEMEQEKQ